MVRMICIARNKMLKISSELHPTAFREFFSGLIRWVNGYESNLWFKSKLWFKIQWNFRASSAAAASIVPILLFQYSGFTYHMAIQERVTCFVDMGNTKFWGNIALSFIKDTHFISTCTVHASNFTKNFARFIWKRIETQRRKGLETNYLKSDLFKSLSQFAIISNKENIWYWWFLMRPDVGDSYI